MQGGVASVGTFQVKNREGGRQEQLCSDLGSAFTALPAVLLGWALGLGGGAQLFLVVQARALAAGERRIKVGCVQRWAERSGDAKMWLAGRRLDGAGGGAISKWRPLGEWSAENS